MKKPTLKANQNRKQGEYYEQIAAEYLKLHNLDIITFNYTCRQGEIDIICQQASAADKINNRDLPTLVFVEVKYRKSNRYGGAIASVSQSKQRKLRHTAQYYMQQHGLNENYIPCRFDVIAIDGSIDNIAWITNAF